MLSQRTYHKITVQEIIDEADIGRTTFYAHFETKDELLNALCEELFEHIISTAMDCSHSHGLYSKSDAPDSVFLHLLQHLQENNRNILGLLGCENNELFLRYFKNSLEKLVQLQLEAIPQKDKCDLPDDFLVNHISSTFVEMVRWWLQGGRQQTPDKLAGYFSAVTKPIFG